MNSIQNRLKNNLVCFANVADPQGFYNQRNIFKQHGLYDLFDCVFVYNNKHTIVLDKKDILLEYDLLHSNVMLFIKEFANGVKNVKIFYFHTKKFSDNSEENNNLQSYFNYFLIEKHKLCINALDKYTCVCVNNNFSDYWWANSDYIKDLADITLFGNIAYADCRKFLSLYPAYSNKLYSYEAISTCILKNLQTLYVKKRPIYGCYFIYCHGPYLKIIDEQIDLLLTNGLYNITDKLLVFVCNATEQCMERFKKLEKAKVICTKENLCEKYAINNYKKYIKDESYFLYYFHAKGVSKAVNMVEKQEIIDWRAMCNYFTLVKWRLCLELLEYYDCVGANLTNFPRRHFSGNFWWATSEHLKTLSGVGSKWLAPELYVCQQPHTNCISLHQSPSPLGCVLYDKSNYNKKTDQQLLANLTAIPIYNASAYTWFDMWYDAQTADDIDKLIYAHYKTKQLPKILCNTKTFYQTSNRLNQYEPVHSIMAPNFLKSIVLNNKKLKSCSP